jgi:hypothetical protein
MLSSCYQKIEKRKASVRKQLVSNSKSKIYLKFIFIKFIFTHIKEENENVYIKG